MQAVWLLWFPGAEAPWHQPGLAGGTAGPRRRCLAQGTAWAWSLCCLTCETGRKWELRSGASSVLGDPEPFPPALGKVLRPPDDRGEAWPLDGRGLVSARGEPLPSPFLEPDAFTHTERPLSRGPWRGEPRIQDSHSDGSRTSGVPLNEGRRPARRQGGAIRASCVPRELALPCPPLLHSLCFSPSTSRPHPACGAGTRDAAPWGGRWCVHGAPPAASGPVEGSAAPDVLVGLWADPQAWVHRCSGTTRPLRRGWGRARKPQEAGVSGERHAEPDGEQSLAPRPGHVASPGASWASGPPLCPGEQAVEAASVWADGPGGCTHTHAPAPCPTASPHCSRALQDALLSTRQRRKLRLGTAGTRVSTLSRLMPKLPALGTHPRGNPDPGLEEKAGGGPISATAAPGRRRRGAGGSTELRGLLTKGSHRSVKSFCASLRWEILSSRPGRPEPQARGSLLNTVNFHLGLCNPVRGGPGVC